MNLLLLHVYANSYVKMTEMTGLGVGEGGRIFIIISDKPINICRSVG